MKNGVSPSPRASHRFRAGRLALEPHIHLMHTTTCVRIHGCRRPTMSSILCGKSYQKGHPGLNAASSVNVTCIVHRAQCSLQRDIPIDQRDLQAISCEEYLMSHRLEKDREVSSCKFDPQRHLAISGRSLPQKGKMRQSRYGRERIQVILGHIADDRSAAT